jgi:hypothetical protein
MAASPAWLECSNSFALDRGKFVPVTNVEAALTLLRVSINIKFSTERS